MKEVQNKNHTDEAKRLNEELDQNLKVFSQNLRKHFKALK